MLMYIALALVGSCYTNSFLASILMGLFLTFWYINYIQGIFQHALAPL